MKIFQGEGELKPKELGLSERKPVDAFLGKINPLTTSVPHHTETSQLISRGNSFLKKKKNGWLSVHNSVANNSKKAAPRRF